MNISYNWLKEILPFDMQPEEVAAALTSIGLETGGVEEIQPVRGGLEGLIIGEVITCVAHPDSDHLHITTVDIGEESYRQIVCGAPNVTAGQKVVVAPTGTTLYYGEERMTIKKSKIRGVVSEGMICAEDEVGLGNSHSGIIVLPAEASVGMAAKEFYKIENDYRLEVDITPNRVDATSHLGIARDLAAYLKQTGKPVTLRCPSAEDFRIDDTTSAISVVVENTEACIRYSGLTIRNVVVGESPEWLKNRLTVIGQRPVNNIVDVTNFVLHELGQPLHAFDALQIKGGKVVVRTTPTGIRFTTLDGVERTLTDQDLMICNADEPMCIAGVFGGMDSGVTQKTTDVFLESACFHPVWVRRTARRFGLNTDASFRFERGLDPNQTVFALKRAIMLIQEIAGGTITGEIQDIYPEEIKPYTVALSYEKINTLIGKEIPSATVKSILESLEMEIVSETQKGLSLQVPVYRIDVCRDVDVIEDILRIYGYNNVEISDRMLSTLSYQTDTDRSYQVENLISMQLCGEGYQEILNNSLTRRAYYEELTTWPVDQTVMLRNPLSADLNGMRQTLLFGGLQNIAYNINHKNKNIRFFEFGNCYAFHVENEKEIEPLTAYSETYCLGLWISGRRVENHWMVADEYLSIFDLHASVDNILLRLGIDGKQLVRRSVANDIFSQGLMILTHSGKLLATTGIISRKILKQMDIDNEVFYAELIWNELLDESRKKKITFCEIPRFPEVKRDLALLLDSEVTFEVIRKVAYESARTYLKRVTLFDVYEGKNLLSGKKSYAVSFYLQDEKKTLTDQQIDLIMSKIQKNLESRVGAKLR